MNAEKGIQAKRPVVNPGDEPWADDCQWLLDDEYICDNKSEHEVKVPIGIGASAVIYLCDHHMRYFNSLKAAERKLRSEKRKAAREAAKRQETECEDAA